MKTRLCLILALASFSAQGLSALSWTLTNIFGGDYVNIADADFITFSRKDDGGYETDGVQVSDKFQFDFSSAKFDGRLRLQYQSGQLNGRLGFDGAADSLIGSVRFRGYARFRPVQWIGFAAGNSFFSKYAITASYLAAYEDNSTDAFIAANGFAIIGDIAGLKLIANFGGNSFTSSDEISLNFGFDYNAFDVATVGATFKSVTNDEFSASAYAGLTLVENLILNVGFLYNAKDTDFITDAAKFALSVSAGYKFAGIGLGIYADLVSGLTSEYIDDGETSRHDDDAVPMFIVGRVDYDVTESLVLSFYSSFNLMAGEDDSLEMIFYPYAAYTLSDFGTIKAGVRFGVKEGVLDSFAIPIAWEYKIASK